MGSLPSQQLFLPYINGPQAAKDKRISVHNAGCLPGDWKAAEQLRQEGLWPEGSSLRTVYGNSYQKDEESRPLALMVYRSQEGPFRVIIN